MLRQLWSEVACKQICWRVQLESYCKKHSTVILNPIADDKKMVIVFATVITNVSTFKLTITLKYGPMTKAWLFVLPNRPLL